MKRGLMNSWDQVVVQQPTSIRPKLKRSVLVMFRRGSIVISAKGRFLLAANFRKKEPFDFPMNKRPRASMRLKQINVPARVFVIISKNVKRTWRFSALKMDWLLFGVNRHWTSKHRNIAVHGCSSGGWLALPFRFVHSVLPFSIIRSKFLLRLIILLFKHLSRMVSCESNDGVCVPVCKYDEDECYCPSHTNTAHCECAECERSEQRRCWPSE